MSVDFYFTKPGKRYYHGGLIQGKVETNLQYHDNHMGYHTYAMMRFRMYSLFNVRFGLVWWAGAIWGHGADHVLYPADEDMMDRIERFIPRAIIPIATQGDTDSALSAKEIARLANELRRPDIDIFAEIPEYRIALPVVDEPWCRHINSCGNRRIENDKLIVPDCDVNCERVKEALGKYARVVAEAARLGFGLQW